jgi:hypothetical protein
MSVINIYESDFGMLPFFGKRLKKKKRHFKKWFKTQLRKIFNG